MLHYIYSRSFISVITFMALALTAWGALPARVGARRWRWGEPCAGAPDNRRHPLRNLIQPRRGRHRSDPHPLRRPDRRTDTAGDLPRDADERLPLLPAGADAFQRPTAKVAPLA